MILIGGNILISGIKGEQVVNTFSLLYLGAVRFLRIYNGKGNKVTKRRFGCIFAIP